MLNGKSDSNFILLLRIRAEDNPNLLKWLDKCQDKFTSPGIQNEILKLMSLRILRDIVQQISGMMYTIMVDETTDLSNTEQMVLCLRHVDDDLNVHEELIGLYSLESTSADNIMLTIQDIQLRLNLSINNCRGQCYNGASNMSGIRSGVTTKVSSLEPRALYTHCYGHALNRVIQDGIT
ncbi:Zinc finger MYM-type protein 1-like [Oopsacas minuta]|uniref:Zinc finger MYM-type protein 1-like n=1 Tax=Oopsacas minuta TaxID=111878 RepID=A0AAV7KBF6_9METZ|nr:Zinc finger MYM-type protein 1-like [Oopsacas minuta]